MVIKNDELYMDLLVWHMEDSERLDELVNEGYLVRDGQLLTEKAVTFMDSYFEAKNKLYSEKFRNMVVTSNILER